jgi:hypothetical protein
MGSRLGWKSNTSWLDMCKIQTSHMLAPRVYASQVRRHVVWFAQMHLRYPTCCLRCSSLCNPEVLRAGLAPSIHLNTQLHECATYEQI